MKKIIGMILLTASMNLYASNLSFLNYSAISYFTTQDTEIMYKTMINTLNNARDNSKTTWSNPKTGANGSFIPSHTTMNNGRKCRSLSIFTEANKVEGKSKYNFCKIDNAWRIL
jgi:surface antigen